MAVVAVVGQLAREAMAVAAKATALPKRDRSGAAVDRFLQDSRRRSCSFVNLSPNALQELTETARRHQLVLTSCVEQNVGTVARLAWPNRAIDAPAAVVPREPVCPRCAHRGKQASAESTDPASWRAAPLRLCAACSQPASPPSVISSASVMRQPSAPEEEQIESLLQLAQLVDTSFGERAIRLCSMVADLGTKILPTRRFKILRDLAAGYAHARAVRSHTL